VCGIAGWLGTVPAAEDDLAAAMTGALHHRGPDASASRAFACGRLLHTRLRIIDLSETGDQPMADEAGDVWTVFNGEIYNHRALRRGLASRHVFRGTSDTEVLPHLYEEQGAAFVKELRGMFAFAILDERRGRLLLARDRFGIKPLFYAVCDGFIVFASELNALRLVPGVDLTPDPQAIADYASLLFVPAPSTLFKGIRVLEPGTMLEATLDEGRVVADVSRYHAWSVEQDTTLTLERAADRADELIDQAVARQLESDVPLGSLLSGGIDSSLVSRAAQVASADAGHTYNMRSSDPGYDETWAALAVADAIGSRHETLEMGEGVGTWDAVSGLLRHVGQPFADSSLFAVREVAQAMRRRVTVALSGDGGDEAFGGYDHYWQLRPIHLLRSAPTPVARLASVAALPAARAGIVRATMSQRLTQLTGADDATTLATIFTWIRPEEQRSLLADSGSIAPVARLFEPTWGYSSASSSKLERLAAGAVEANVRLVLPDDYLFKVDAGSMRESLEVRVPMLDEDLVDFGLRLPLALRAGRRTSKVVLREVARRRLPPAVARKPKQGFTVPVDRWVDVSFKERLRERLTDPASPVADVFRRDTYLPWVEAFAGDRSVPGISRGGLYQRALMLLSLDLSLAP
jgi:asparagine synthase (glutamine-hydrolysing)